VSDFFSFRTLPVLVTELVSSKSFFRAFLGELVTELTSSAAAPFSFGFFFFTAFTLSVLATELVSSSCPFCFRTFFFTKSSRLITELVSSPDLSFLLVDGGVPTPFASLFLFFGPASSPDDAPEMD
jgi:hypothetical protein